MLVYEKNKKLNIQLNDNLPAKDTTADIVVESFKEGSTDKTKVTVKGPLDAETSVWERGTGENSVQTKGSLCEATGDNSVATGMNTHSGATASHSEGALTATRNDYNEETETGFDAAYSHVEGLNNATNNVAEHGEGKFGWSYYDENHDPAKSSIRYVGIGTNNQDEYRKDAEVTMVNGDKYILGVGGYDGKNIENAKTIQEVITELYQKLAELQSK